MCTRFSPGKVASARETRWKSAHFAAAFGENQQCTAAENKNKKISACQTDVRKNVSDAQLYIITERGWRSTSERNKRTAEREQRQRRTSSANSHVATDYKKKKTEKRLEKHYRRRRRRRRLSHYYCRRVPRAASSAWSVASNNNRVMIRAPRVYAAGPRARPMVQSETRDRWHLRRHLWHTDGYISERRRDGPDDISSQDHRKTALFLNPAVHHRTVLWAKNHDSSVRRFFFSFFKFDHYHSGSSPVAISDLHSEWS